MKNNQWTHPVIFNIAGVFALVFPVIIASIMLAGILTPLFRITPWENPWYLGLWITLSPAIYFLWLFLQIGYFTLDLRFRRVFMGMEKRKRTMSCEDGFQFLQIVSLYLRARYLFSLPFVESFLMISYLRDLVFLAYSIQSKVSSSSLTIGYLYDPDLTEVGDHTIIGTHTAVVAHSITVEPDGSWVVNTAPVKIGSRVMIGGNGRVDLGVVIGADAMVEPFSFVTAFTSIGPGEIWGGNPARFLRMRPEFASNESLQEPLAKPVNQPSENTTQAAVEILSLALNIPAEEITDDINVENCTAWDSLTQLSMSMELQKKLGIMLSNHEAFRLRSINDVKRIIELNVASPVQN